MSTTMARSHKLTDLHIEFPRAEKLKIPKKAPYLALIGDIGVLYKAKKEAYRQFLLDQAEIFDKVLVILGNHG